MGEISKVYQSVQYRSQSDTEVMVRATRSIVKGEKMKRGEEKGEMVKKSITKSTSDDMMMMMKGKSASYIKMVKMVIMVLVIVAMLPEAYEARPSRHRRGAHVHSCGTPAVCNCINDLRWVDCSNRDLEEIPDFPRFVYLSTVRLFLNGNGLSSIPSDEYWMKWKSLETVDFSSNPVCQDAEVVSARDDSLDIISEVCPTNEPQVTTATPTSDLPPEPSKRRRPPLAVGKNITSTTVVTTTTTTTTLSSYTTGVDEDETEATTTTGTTDTTEKISDSDEPGHTDDDRGTVDKNKERIIMIGSLSVSVPLGFAAITCCLRGVYKRVRKSIKRVKSEKEMAKEAREEVRRARRQKRDRYTLSSLFDCGCNTGEIDEVSHFGNPNYKFSIGEEGEEEESVIFTKEHETVRMRTPSLSKEE